MNTSFQAKLLISTNKFWI